MGFCKDRNNLPPPVLGQRSGRLARFVLLLLRALFSRVFCPGLKTGSFPGRLADLRTPQKSLIMRSFEPEITRLFLLIFAYI